ncbi:MAG TPA: DUF4010 domain-containing protein [Tepidiformaceae bacterium]|nr:DUF4010 domain-containing protein [Tepidiformaceae bacterium]
MLFLASLPSIDLSTDAARLGVALGIGMLLGVERERRKVRAGGKAIAGIRTFALVSLAGGVAMVLGSEPLLAVVGGFVGLAAITGYFRTGSTDDPGLTTEAALVIAYLLGALAIEDPKLAAGFGVLVAIVLAARERLHAFVARTLTEQELNDGLLFGAAALVILPLVPNREVGPFDVFNPFSVWRLVVVVMAISASGYLAVRMLGPRLGLPLAGFASGFVSSSATIGAMGARVRQQPSLLTPAVAGAVLSTVATVVQMIIVVGATSPDTLSLLWSALAPAGIVAAAYGALMGLHLRHANDGDVLEPGHAFDLKTAVIFAATVTVVLFVSAAAQDQFGAGGVVFATALAGFADAHSAAISAASLAAAGRIEPADAVVPILAGLTAHTATKALLAYATGRQPYAWRVWAGILLVIVAAWAGWAVTEF